MHGMRFTCILYGTAAHTHAHTHTARSILILKEIFETQKSRTLYFSYRSIKREMIFNYKWRRRRSIHAYVSLFLGETHKNRINSRKFRMSVFSALTRICCRGEKLTTTHWYDALWHYIFMYNLNCFVMSFVMFVVVSLISLMMP